jgi:O-antigen/teichoic acid export membrane protein
LSSNDSQTNRSFTFNVLTLAGGTAFSQAIGMIAIPLLTRLYTPTDYGHYALYTASFNLLVPLVHLRYALAIMLPKEDQEALEILRLSLRLSLFFGLVLFAILIFGDLSFFQIPEALHSPWILALISSTLIFGGVIQSYIQWSNRVKNYFLMSLSRVTQISGMVVSQSIAGFIWGSSLLGLMFGHFLGHVFGLGTLIKQSEDLKGKSLLFSPATPLLEGIKRYKSFPLYNSWGSILDGISSYSAPLLFAIYFLPDMVGRYALANTVIVAPIMLIGNSIAKVFFQKISEDLKNGLDIMSLIHSIIVRKTLISFSIAGVIYFYGPSLFGLFFGENWSSAGHFAQILIPVMVSQLLVSGVLPVLLVKEKQGLMLVAQSIRTIITVASIMIPGFTGFNEIETLTIFSFSRTFANLVYLAIIYRVARAA